MIDALLYAVRDGIRGAGYNYNQNSCEIMGDDRPPPRCGDRFAAVYQMPSQSVMMNALDEYFAFGVTLTRRVTVPLDRLGDQLLAKKVARKLARTIGFNAECEQLRAFLHMNWGILQDANQNLISLEPDANMVYGFVEPAHFAGMETPILVGGEWFNAEPEASDVGLKAELRFDGTRRLQPIALYV
jgi:hypothetical protein